MTSFAGRNVLVTGGTRGIGRAIAMEFARAGAHVLANYVRNEESADSLVADARSEGLSIAICRADLTAPNGVTALEAALDSLGEKLHVYVHSAATGVHRLIDDLTLRHYDWTFALNVRAFFDLTRRLIPRLEQESSIIVISSGGAVRAVPAYSLVGASKGAIEALSRHLAVELAPRGIRVNILAPGAVATDAWAAIPNGEERLAEICGRTPTGRLTTAEEVAYAALFLCSDRARSIVGQTLVIDGGAGIPV